MGHIFIYITCESHAQAEGLGQILVERGVAACVNVLPPICSIYRWEGEVMQEEEFPVIVKTRAALFKNVEEIVKELHSYDNPCIVSLPINQGSEPFLKWIDENTIKS